MIVRFEADAYVAPKDSLTAGRDLLPASSAGFPSVRSTDHSTFNTSLKIVGGGSYVDQSNIVELKTRTRAKRKPEDRAQLFFGQIHHLFLAVHDKGHFERVQKAEFMPSILANEQLLGLLQRLISVLKALQGVTRQHGHNGRLTLVCHHGGKLEIFRRLNRTSCLPKYVFERFEHGWKACPAKDPDLAPIVETSC